MVSCQLQTLVVLTSFPFWIPCISFTCLIAMAKSSKTILNNSGESGDFCLVPGLRGNTSVLYH